MGRRAGGQASGLNYLSCLLAPWPSAGGVQPVWSATPTSLQPATALGRPHPESRAFRSQLPLSGPRASLSPGSWSGQGGGRPALRLPRLAPAGPRRVGEPWQGHTEGAQQRGRGWLGGRARCPSPIRAGFPQGQRFALRPPGLLPQVAVWAPKLALRLDSPGFKFKSCSLSAESVSSPAPHLCSAPAGSSIPRPSDLPAHTPPSAH